MKNKGKQILAFSSKSHSFKRISITTLFLIVQNVYIQTQEKRKWSIHTRMKEQYYRFSLGDKKISSIKQVQKYKPEK